MITVNTKIDYCRVYLDNVIANGAGVKYAANGYSEANWYFLQIIALTELMVLVSLHSSRMK